MFGSLLLRQSIKPVKCARARTNEHAKFQAVLKKIAKATGASDYNVLQNNGRKAHQLVDHVHFHLIPKPNDEEGLGIEWPTKEADQGELKSLAADLKSKM